jgi:FixJ family two-component response regulator
LPDPGKQIYIIDEDENVCRALARLVRTECYRPVTMSCRREFLDREDIDLSAAVICDLRMPGLNGIEVYEMMGSQNFKLPFIFITAVDDDVLMDQANRLGNAFFQKPFDGQKLLDRLSNLCRT